MKCKKILTALLAAACTMSGCHGDLDIMQDNKLSASNMWIDESDAETATYGIYLYMRDALKSVHDIYLCWGEFRNGLWGAGTNKTLSGVDQTQVRTSTMSSSNAYADWSVMYKTVNQANLILKHVPEMGISESVRNFSLGNAYFSRAWCYFWIARIWGDAPLALTGYESTGGDLYLPRAPKAEIFARIESDLTEAERYVTDNSDKAVATPAAVQMLKADYALWMYRVAGGGSSYLTMAEKAIEALNLSASRLESDYAQVFSSANKLNKEVIFAFSCLTEDGSSIKISNQFYSYNHPNKGSYNYRPAGDVMTMYADNDLRKEVSITTLDNLNFVNKYPSGQTGSDPVVISRLAEMYLISAEAQGLNGGLDRLNELREKRGLDRVSPGNEADFLDAVLQERRLEFLAEGFRWYDLVRTGKATQTLGTKDYQCLMPLPSRELLYNPNLKPNNPGY